MHVSPGALACAAAPCMRCSVKGGERPSSSPHLEHGQGLHDGAQLAVLLAEALDGGVVHLRRCTAPARGARARRPPSRCTHSIDSGWPRSPDGRADTALTSRPAPLQPAPPRPGTRHTCASLLALWRPSPAVEKPPRRARARRARAYAPRRTCSTASASSGVLKLYPESATMCPSGSFFLRGISPPARCSHSCGGAARPRT